MLDSISKKHYGDVDYLRNKINRINDKKLIYTTIDELAVKINNNAKTIDKYTMLQFSILILFILLCTKVISIDAIEHFNIIEKDIIFISIPFILLFINRMHIDKIINYYIDKYTYNALNGILYPEYYSLGVHNFRLDSFAFSFDFKFINYNSKFRTIFIVINVFFVDALVSFVSLLFSCYHFMESPWVALLTIIFGFFVFYLYLNFPYIFNYKKIIKYFK